MIWFVCVSAAVLCAPVLASDHGWNGLRAKYLAQYSEGGTPKGFFSVPRTKEEAIRTGEWVVHKTPLDDGDYLGHPISLPNDNRFSVLLDDNGYICGVQIGISVKEVDTPDNPYHFDPKVFQRVNRFEEEIYLVTLYTVDPGVIKVGGRSRRDFESQGTGTDLYIQEGSSYNIRKLSAPPKGDPLFTKGKCFPKMGTHYHYNMTRNLRCEEMYPIFLLHDNNKLTGFGFQTFGTVNPRGRQWFEYNSGVTFDDILYEYPDCLGQIAGKAGYVTMHVYFKDDPWNIRCQQGKFNRN